MRKNLFAALIAVLSIAFSNSANAKTKTTTVSSPGSFSAGPFGCWGSGFCTTTTTVETSIASTGFIENNGDGTVTIHWTISLLNQKNQEYYGRVQTFESTKSVPISAKECKALNLPVGTNFSIGKFPIENNGKELVIIIPVE